MLAFSCAYQLTPFCAQSFLIFGNTCALVLTPLLCARIATFPVSACEPIFLHFLCKYPCGVGVKREIKNYMEY